MDGDKYHAAAHYGRSITKLDFCELILGLREIEIHGPAWTVRDTESKLSLDSVLSIRCLSWPIQAADWPTRHRNRGWPDSVTVRYVVSNGCDVVEVAHRLCRQDEWMNKQQWRLSFSRAEIVLLNSWMPVQQIIYHMLRVFVKTNRLVDITDSTGTKVFSNYHIKTLMLWACELKPTRWWIDSSNLIRICAHMLRWMVDWLNDKNYLHYFVNDCNLVITALHLEIITSQLVSITESCLSTWFVDNYLRKCAQLCPDRVSRLFDDVSTRMKLRNAASAVVDWRLNSALHDLWVICDEAETTLLQALSCHSLTLRSYDYWISELTKIDSCLCVYSTAVAFLHVAYKTTRNGLNDKLLNVLGTLLGELIGNTSELDTSLRVDLLQQSAVERLTTYRQLKAHKFGSVATIVTTDIEALYEYKRGDYQRCLQLSTQNVHSLLYGEHISHISIGLFPEFLQLLDDDVVSLSALTMIVSHQSGNYSYCCMISQLTLSLYLMTQCQLKLHHSVTSLAQTLDYIEVARRKHPVDRTFDHLTLRLIDRKIMTSLSSII